MEPTVISHRFVCVISITQSKARGRSESLMVVSCRRPYLLASPQSNKRAGEFKAFSHRALLLKVKFPPQRKSLFVFTWTLGASHTGISACDLYQSLPDSIDFVFS